MRMRDTEISVNEIKISTFLPTHTKMMDSSDVFSSSPKCKRITQDKRERIPYPHCFHSYPSTKQCLLLLLVGMTGSHHFFILAVAADAFPTQVMDSQSFAPVGNFMLDQFWSSLLIPWITSKSTVSLSTLVPNRHEYSTVNQSSTNEKYRKTKMDSLLVNPSLSKFHSRPVSRTLEHIHLSIRGGGGGGGYGSKKLDDNLDEEEINNLDILSHIDDDVPAEELLDIIFDGNNELSPVAKSFSSKNRIADRFVKKDGQQQEDDYRNDDNLRSSINTKTWTNVRQNDVMENNDVMDLDLLFPQGTSKESAEARQGPLTSIMRDSKTRLTPGEAMKTRSRSVESIRGSFRNELDRLTKKSSNLLSQRISVDQVPRSFDHQTKNSLNFASNQEKAPYDPRMHETKTAPTQTLTRIPTNSKSPAFVRREPPINSSSNIQLNSPSAPKHPHAVWGPHAQHRRTKPGPPPTKATEDELRAHETQSRIRQERKKLLSNLAIQMNDSHTSAVRALIRGSAAHIPPELFGQTIMQEKSACNEMFHGSMMEVKSSLSGRSGDDDALETSPVVLGEEIEAPSPSFRHIEDPTLLSYWGLTPHAKLYGGAQYHRVLRYYHHMFLTVPLPPITDDEVALLTNGITEVHDASDLMRAVALLVRQKMEIVMEDVLADMTRRILYVLDRQWEMVEYSMALHRPMGGANGLGKSGDKVLSEADLLRRHGIEYSTAESGLKNVLSTGFHNFARERAAMAHRQSLEDMRSLLRYVTWDMGRARKRVPNQGRKDQGFVSQIEIVGGEAFNIDESAQGHTDNRRPAKKSKKHRKKKDRSQSASGSSERIRARGGGAVGSERKRSRRWNEKGTNRSQRPQEGKGQDLEDDMGDLIGGVMNRGNLDSVDDDNASVNQSMIISSKSSPIFSGDDEVMSVLLATVSSTLAPKSDIQAGHTQAAIDNLVSYVTDRMRMDMSRMIRSKFNTFFLLAFYEDLGPYLSRELDAHLSSLE
ncbi:hypothetical protein ACHAWX_003961 [Stephanocyclus meneghinianus]